MEKELRELKVTAIENGTGSTTYPHKIYFRSLES